MSKRIFAAGLLTIASLMLLPSRTAASTSVSISVDIAAFHERLSPYGDWITVSRYGQCWRPRRIARTWRPYTVGYWTDTDYGWTWVSDEDWGWATYHYGRWYLDPAYGWVWVPGGTWAPAYVTWQYGDDWIGWAPLPPGVEPGYSVRVGGLVPASAYSFVQVRFFLDRRLSGHFAPESRNAGLIQSTRNATQYAVQGSRIVDSGVDVHEIERASGQRVEQLRVRDAGSAAPPRATVANHELSVYRPSVARSLEPSHAITPATRTGGRPAQVEQRHIQPTTQPRATTGRTGQDRAVGSAQRALQPHVERTTPPSHAAQEQFRGEPRQQPQAPRMLPQERPHVQAHQAQPRQVQQQSRVQEQPRAEQQRSPAPSPRPANAAAPSRPVSTEAAHASAGNGGPPSKQPPAKKEDDKGKH